MRFRRASILIGAVVAASLAVAGIAGAAATAHHATAAVSPTWTAADVAKVAKANGVPPFTPIDSVVPGASHIGVPDVQAGTIAAQILATEIKSRLAGSWKGKSVFFVGLGVPGCTPCEVRPHTALKVLSRSVKIDGSSFIS